jgi:proteasome accessory factor C
LFRLDRVDEVTKLDEPTAPPPFAEHTDVSAGLFRPQPDQEVAQLVLEPDAHWVSEYYPVEEVEELDGGRLRIWMRYADSTWMVRLVLGLGGEVTVERPVELLETVRACARQALTRSSHLSVT